MRTIIETRWQLRWANVVEPNFTGCIPFTKANPEAISFDMSSARVGLRQRGIRPGLILFADTGAERQATYDYLPVINAWLASASLPTVTVVR